MLGHLLLVKTVYFPFCQSICVLWISFSNIASRRGLLGSPLDGYNKHATVKTSWDFMCGIHTHTHHLTSMLNTFMKFSLISQWFVDWRSRSFFHSTSLIYAMLGTKDCEKEGDCIIPTRTQFSCGRPVPQWPGDTPAGEKGWSEGSEGSKKGAERDEKGFPEMGHPQRRGIVRQREQHGPWIKAWEYRTRVGNK